MDKFICPKCGQRTMIKKEQEGQGYTLVCQNCGFKHNMLPTDENKHGFV